MKLADSVVGRRIINVLWERSPDRDFCSGPCRKSAQDESLGRRVRCAPEALPIIVESRLVSAE